ncbi:hypothetical protein BLNAU_833 [Blattamonas nauphoetae]|uniref:Uncharacterized protein n=1 Tax=Blattamonas nauphoetae TaxID=2049346 RepID=A0ABQ9Y3P8_9EUKA|nr:hypothetical protein BLNAU_20446 [Blattamonas nauphoetae]KAK2947113.1 hypothetical protein BLNAU_17965 [Blattamonas nauphoetae]KAK2948708.1 hypothetical protein BLNAU_16346 [Blattamonas nauphoetae]KAK2950686.1 hypothetical protein BLNAU_14357 [Blattamonas nauphoetae]KAK2952017.1 hypothetical protein BLNAU_12999 [Blattamonas nauphoetae]
MKMNQPGSKVTLEENHNPWRKQLSYPGFFPFDTFSINVFDCSNALHGSDPLYRALGKFRTCIAVLAMGLVFCQRLLMDYAFWRAVVSVGTAAGIILAGIMQPFYSRLSNFLMLHFSVFGTLRLGLEIDFLVDSGTGQIIGTIIFGII